MNVLFHLCSRCCGVGESGDTRRPLDTHNQHTHIYDILCLYSKPRRYCNVSCKSRRILNPLLDYQAEQGRATVASTQEAACCCVWIHSGAYQFPLFSGWCAYSSRRLDELRHRPEHGVKTAPSTRRG